MTGSLGQLGLLPECCYQRRAALRGSHPAYGEVTDLRECARTEVADFMRLQLPQRYYTGLSSGA